jgi:hypothetical protein
MMDPYAIATTGISSNPFLTAVLGYSFEAVIVVPSGSTGAGNIAHAYVYYQYDNKKRVKIQLTCLDRHWEEEYEYEEDIPGYLRTDTDSVVASFIRLQPVSASAEFLRYVINNETTIKVRKL